MKNETAITGNLSDFLMAIGALEQRKERILIGSGKAGFGKTTMMIYAANSINAAVISANASWTVKWMLSDLCDQLSIRRSGSVQAMYESIILQLKDSKRNIFVDEANLLVEGRDFKSILVILSMLYRIHDEAQVGIVILGQSTFPEYVRSRANQSESIGAFTQRCARWIDFKPCGFDDARLIANARLEVKITDDQLSAISIKSKGNTRELIMLLTEYERTEKAKIKPASKEG